MVYQTIKSLLLVFQWEEPYRCIYRIGTNYLQLDVALCLAFLIKIHLYIRYIWRYKLPYYYFLISTHLTLVFCYHAQHLKNNPGIHAPPLLQFHGVNDKLVPIKWGVECYNSLKELGVNTQFVPLNNVDHELSKIEIQAFKEWILDILPQKLFD